MTNPPVGINHVSTGHQGCTMCFSQPEITDIVIFFRLSLYNQAKPCSAKAIHHEMQSARITPLPSIGSIHRILVQRISHTSPYRILSR